MGLAMKAEEREKWGKLKYIDRIFSNWEICSFYEVSFQY